MSDDFEKTKAAAIRTAQAVLARRHNLPLYHGEIHEPMPGYVNKRLRRFRTRQVSTIEKFVVGNKNQTSFGEPMKTIDIDDLVDEWHDKNCDVPLYEFLKMSKEEFDVWIQFPNKLPEDLASRFE